MAGFSGIDPPYPHISLGSDDPTYGTSPALVTCINCHRIKSVFSKCVCEKHESSGTDFKTISSVKDLSDVMKCTIQIGVKQRQSDDQWCVIIRIPWGTGDGGLDMANRMLERILDKND